MADVLGLDPGAITDGTARDNTSAWDSANHITLTLALEEEFGIAFDVDELESMFSFADVIQVLQTKL